MLRKIFLLLLVAVFCLSGCAALQPYRFLSPEQEDKIFSSIEEIKDFGKSLGLIESGNFTQFGKSGSYLFIHYHKKDIVPFSYRDPSFFEEKVRFGKEQKLEQLAAHGITKENYEISFFNALGLSVNSRITPEVAALSKDRLARLIFHEDFHATVDFPVHAEEAMAVLVEWAAAGKFMGWSKEKITVALEKFLEKAENINITHDLLAEEAARLEKGRITLKEYEKTQALLFSPYREAEEFDREMHSVKLARLHTYCHYFPLMYRLYCALGSDIGEFIRLLKELDEEGKYKEKLAIGKGGGFKYNRAIEKKLEKRLEEIIFSLENK